jgi:hypothetical protein
MRYSKQLEVAINKPVAVLTFEKKEANRIATEICKFI